MAIAESETTVSEFETAVSEFETGVSESETVVSESETVASESETAMERVIMFPSTCLHRICKNEQFKIVQDIENIHALEIG